MKEFQLFCRIIIVKGIFTIILKSDFFITFTKRSWLGIKKKDVAKLIYAFNSLSFIFGLYIYFKTNSFTHAILASLGGIVLIQVVRFTIIGMKNKKLMRSGIHEVDEMDGFQFEEFLALLFKGHEYRTNVTKSRGDFGADLILKKNDVKTVVQAKRYSSNVGIKAVQEIIGTVQHYKAGQSMVVTNSYYTRAATELARTNNVKLINRDQLINMLLEVHKDNSATDF